MILTWNSQKFRSFTFYGVIQAHTWPSLHNEYHVWQRNWILTIFLAQLVQLLLISPRCTGWLLRKDGEAWLPWRKLLMSFTVNSPRTNLNCPFLSLFFPPPPSIFYQIYLKNCSLISKKLKLSQYFLFRWSNLKSQLLQINI